MSTEPKRVAKAAAWTAWENQVINGVFPLRRFIGTSRHGVVFQTEYSAGEGANPSDAAIKLVPADAMQAEAYLAQWQAAATITHPHLVHLFDMGRCQLGGRGFVFLVMEYAEQTLAQILAGRALTPDEAQELLPPALSALACLHHHQFVHGQLKPSNILSVNDQLKLSSDSVRPAGQAPSGISRTSLYDPPELRDGVISAAGDIWALGMALVEALTQRTWAGSRGQGETTTSLLASLPTPFAETARRCLSRAPADRPAAVELEAQFRPAPQDEVIADEVLSTPPPPAAELAQATEVAPATDVPDTTQTPETAETLAVAETPQNTEASEAPETQSANEASNDPNASQSLSLTSLSLRAIAGGLLLFLSVWAILRG